MENARFILSDKVAAQPANNPEKNSENNAEESWTNKALREVQLVGQGAAGVFVAAKDAVSSEHRLETAGEVALSIGAGLGLAYLNRGRGLGLLAARTLETAGTLSFLKNSVEHGSEAVSAISDAWRSGENMRQDSATMKHSVGGFVFDAGLMSIGGMAGARAGHTLFKPVIPENFFFQMSNKTGIRVDYYNKLYISEMMANKLVDPDLPAERIVAARAKLPEILRDTRTYSAYWDGEIAKFQASNPDHPKLDATGIKNFLVADRPAALKLDRLAAEVRTYADKDLDNPQVLDSLIDKYQAGRRIIYGNDPMQSRRLISDEALTPEEMNVLIAKDRSSMAKLLDRFGFNRAPEIKPEKTA